MGCGASAAVVESEPVQEIAEDPLAKLLRQIEVERIKLKASEQAQANAESALRYNSTAVKKLQRITRVMKETLEDEEEVYNSLKRHIAKQDALDIFEASDGFGTDEEKMANVVVGRLPETLKITDEIYKKLYGRTLEDQIRGENKTLLGLMTGSMTHFGRFLTYRCMPQAKRDAYLLHKAMSGFGCSDYILVEILSTRTNQQLKDAAAAYAEEHDGESLEERIQKETGGFGKKWYGKWVDTLVEFDRNEEAGVVGDPEEQAQALYDAGEGKWMGCDEQVFIDILCKANEETCQAIRDSYDSLENSKMSLVHAVESKMGGDLEFAVLARVRSKTEFMAMRIYKACKGWGTDEECIGRVISCLTKAEAQMMEHHYNEFYKEEEAPFNNLRDLLASELSGSFLDAMLALIDISAPKGHSVHEDTYPAEAERAAHYFCEQVSANYSEHSAQQLGKGSLDGPLSLCGLEDLFICSGFDFYQTESKPVFQHPDRAHLLQGEPEDMDSAQQLLAALQQEHSGVQSAAENAQRGKAAMEEQVPKMAKGMKFIDHYLHQITMDNIGMLEFCASRDADLVHEAVDGWGTDEDKLIRVLCALPKKQLQRVDEIYTERYGKSLREVTDCELSGMFEGDFKYFMKCVLTKDVDLDAELLKESMEGWGTNDGLLCELLCTRSNQELNAAKAIFAEKEGKPVEEWVDGDTSGDYQSLLLACLKADREESLNSDEAAAKLQASQLNSAGFGGSDSNSDVIISILATASVAQVEAINIAYQEEFGMSMAEAIKKSMGGDWEKALLARCYDKSTYYAITLQAAFKRWGTDEKAVSRILGRNNKGDIKRIAARFQQLFDQSLHNAIESELSGNFKKALLTMLFEEAPGEKTKQEMTDAENPEEPSLAHHGGA